MPANRKRLVVASGSVLLAVLMIGFGLRWQQPEVTAHAGDPRPAQGGPQTGTENAAEIQRPAKSTEDLLYDLKKYDLLAHSTRIEWEGVRTPAQSLVALGPPVVPRLCQALGEPDRYGLEVPPVIGDILGDIGDPRAGEALIDAIARYSGTTYANRFAIALKKTGYQHLERLLELLHSPNQEIQIAAVSGCYHVADSRAVDPLLDVLRSGPQPVRRWAASSLGGIGDLRAVPPLIEILKTCEDGLVLSAIAMALGRLGDRRAVEPLIEILKKHPPKSTEGIIIALGALGDPRAVEPLLGLMDTQRGSGIIRALQQIGGDEAVRGLIAATKSRYANLKKARRPRPSTAELFLALAAIGAASVEPLIQELEDPHSPMRMDAVKALGRIGDRRAVAPLMAALQDADNELAEDIFVALGKIGDARATDVLVAALDSNLYAGQALASLRPPPIEALCELLKSPVERRSRGAARALADLGDPRTLDRLIEAYRPPPAAKDYAVRCYLITAVGKIAQPETIQFVARALRDENDNVRRDAVEALARIGGPSAVPPLINALDDKGHLVADLAARALGNIPDPRAVEPLIQFMAREKQESALEVDGRNYSGSVTRRRSLWQNSYAEIALLKIGSPAVRPLLRVLEGPSHGGTAGAIRVLSRLGDRRAVEPLIRKLDERDAFVRGLAVAGLAELGDGRAVPPLLKAAAQPLRDPATTDRTPDGLMALGLGDVDPVITALHDKLGHVRTEAARALLARKNPAADALWILGLEAVDPLIAALDSQDANMRKLAERALKIIGEPRGLEAIARRTSETDTR